MHILLKVGLSLFETVLLILFLNHILISDDTKSKIKKILFVMYFFFQCITYMIDFAFFSTSVYYIMFTAFISITCYLDEMRIKLIASSIFVTLNYACKLFSTTIISSLTNNSLPEKPFDYILTDEMQILACFLVLFVIFFIKKTPRKPNKFIDLLIFALPLLNLYQIMQVLSNKGNVYFQITLLLFVYSFFLLFIIEQIMHSVQSQQRFNSMQQILEVQQAHYQDLEEYSYQMSRLRHDLKNHLSVLNSLVSKGNLEQAKKYISSYSHDILDTNTIISTGNHVVDAILNSKVKKAKSSNIDIKCEIVIPPDFRIPNTDLAIILGNLLDNSIEATSKLDSDREINMRIKLHKDSLFIFISNTYDGVLFMDNGRILSSKKRKKEHGLGLGNVAYIVKKNKGTIDLDHDEREFKVSILIPNAYY